MAFCKYCGKELKNGEICLCKKENSLSPENTTEVGKKTVIPKEKRLPLFVGTVCILVILASMVGIVVYLFNSGSKEQVVKTSLNDIPEYEKPVHSFTRAYSKNNMEKLLTAMLPEGYIAELKEAAEDDGKSWEQFIDEVNKKLEDTKSGMEEEYGENIRLEYKVIDHKELKQSEREKLEKWYDAYDANLSDAYKIKLEFTTKGSKDEDSEKGWVYVVEVKGEGWQLCPEGDGLDPISYVDF